MNIYSRRWCDAALTQGIYPMASETSEPENKLRKNWKKVRVIGVNHFKTMRY